MNEATRYRLAARALYAPFGGLREIRRRVLDALRIAPGARVLELGCGPGDVTAELIARGATVEGVDGSAAMLREAATRAPGATLVQSDVRAYRPDGTFDAIVILFVLHELPLADLPGLLRTASSWLRPGGRLVIADHALPAGAGRGIWRVLLRLVESRRIDAWLDVDLRALMRGAALTVDGDVPLAGGRVRLVAGVAPGAG